MRLQERKKAGAEGLRFRRLKGGEVSEAQWDAFYDFYLNTTGKLWKSVSTLLQPTLNADPVRPALPAPTLMQTASGARPT